MLDIHRSDLFAGVAGSGTMGRGIAHVLAQCGVRTLVFDGQPGAAQAAKDAIGETLAGLVHKGRVSQADADRTLARIEVVDGELTESWVGDALVALAKRYGHKPVRCKDTPGFIVNHAGRGYVPESLRVLQEGVADFATIDRVPGTALPPQPLAAAKSTIGCVSPV